MTQQIIQGKRCVPARIDGFIGGVWAMDVPAVAAPMTLVRRTYQVQAGRLYLTLVEFVGGKQVLGLLPTIQRETTEWQNVHPCGQSDSPVSYELWDMTPTPTVPPPRPEEPPLP
jgi:hypothetical protein